MRSAPTSGSWWRRCSDRAHVILDVALVLPTCERIARQAGCRELAVLGAVRRVRVGVAGMHRQWPHTVCRRGEWWSPQCPATARTWTRPVGGLRQVEEAQRLTGVGAYRTLSCPFGALLSGVDQITSRLDAHSRNTRTPAFVPTRCIAQGSPGPDQPAALDPAEIERSDRRNPGTSRPRRVQYFRRLTFG